MKKITTLLVGLILPASLLAEPVLPSKAVQLAQKFFTNSELRTLPSELTISYIQPHSDASAPGLRSVATTVSQENSNLYYVINRGDNGGYVVVAGDDRVAPILAYSDKGSLTAEAIQNHPSIRYMFDEYASQMRWAVEHLPDRAHESTRGADLKADDILRSPLLAYHHDRVTRLPHPIQFGQSWPFNQYAPNILVRGRRYPTVAGCVATGISTVMRWHQWPNRPTGQRGYNWNGNWLAVNYDESEGYDWDNIPANITGGGVNAATNRLCNDAEADNVGRLLRDVAYAVKMNYGPAFTGGSGAYLWDIVEPFKNNFGYKKSLRWLQRRNYTEQAWWEQVTDELDTYGPVIYVGHSEGGGHCFVLDGYAKDRYVHVDWGWNGMENGWYKISILEPGQEGIGGGGGGYRSNQQMIRKLEPDRPDDNVRPNPRPNPKPSPNATFTLRLGGRQLDLQQKPNSKPVINYTIENKGTGAYSGNLSVYITPQGKNPLKEFKKVGKGKLDVAAKKTKSVNLYLDLEGVAEGTYEVHIGYPTSDGVDRYIRQDDERTIAKVGTLTVAKKEAPKPKPEIKEGYDLYIAKGVQQDRYVQDLHQKITVQVGNKGSRGYYNMLALCVVRTSDEDYKEILTTATPYVLSRSTVDVSFDTDLTPLSPGKYQLFVAYRKDSKEWSTIASVGHITVVGKDKPQPKPEEKTFKLSLSKAMEDLEVVEGSKPLLPIWVMNSGQVAYDGRIILSLLDANKPFDANAVTQLIDGEPTLEAGESTQLKFYPIMNKVPAGTYNIYLAYFDNGKKKYLTASGSQEVTPVGKIVIHPKKVEPKPEPKPTPEPHSGTKGVAATKAYFYQNNSYLGQDYAIVHSQKGRGKFAVRVYLDAKENYNGNIRVYIANHASERTQVPGKVVEKTIRVKAGQQGAYVTAEFSLSGLSQNYYRIGVQYYNTRAKAWLVYSKTTIPFFVSYKANEYRNPEDEALELPTKGGTYNLGFRSVVIGNPVEPVGDDDPIALGIDDIEPTTSEAVRLTPAVATSTVELTLPQAERVDVYNTLGQLVLQRQGNQGVNTLSVAHLPAGVYIVRVGNTQLKFVRK